MKKYYYMSDLHLEINGALPIYRIVPESNGILLVAGDTTIADYFRKERTDSLARKGRDRFRNLIEQIESFEQILFVTGNHEHYNGDIERTKELFAKELEQYGTKFRVMENDYHFTDAGTVVFGAGLWTNFNNNNPVDHAIVENGMNDFRIIKKGIYKFTTQDAYKIHKETVEKATEVLNTFPHANVIMFTHHAPLNQCNGEEHTGSRLIAGYCSDLSEMILSNPNIKYWVHGHTHTNSNIEIGQCKVLSNQMGYGNQSITFIEKCAEDFLKQSHLPYFEI